MDFLKMMLNLQFFSADTGGMGGADTTADDKKTDDQKLDDKKTDDEKTDDKKSDAKDTKTFTQEELDEIVRNRVARAEKDKQDAIDEAKKLAKMNAEEKKDYDFKKLQRENEELKAAQNKFSLGKEATKMLAGSGIVADDDLLEFVVRENAETTKQAVQAFSALVAAKVDEGVKEKLKGNSPKKQTGAAGSTTKQTILAIKDSAERIKAIQDNPHLFK
ncbi:DUF4355 domain-containing protein [Bacillus sp. FSL K6-3431]|uniref:DUF4355 domain-containing protein n=1 Tax=Bacillus sp. FSL K6-3431 TaxID=2921500 RepID=UPI0030FBC7F0